jgi:SAM-dependent methyltransferase
MSSKYQGSELDVFKGARNWKKYWSSQLRPYVRGAVLEVGGGIGANVPYIIHSGVTSITLLEPDAGLVQRAQTEMPASNGIPVDARHGSIDSLDANGRYETILYIDVIEHIEHDREELAKAARRLSSGGNLIVLVPAYNFLYSEFDKAIGHYRRYSRTTLSALQPPGCELVRLRNLDSAGLLASLVNKLFLRQSVPTEAQIALWDRVLVRASTVLDPLTGFLAGKTLVAVWRKSP